MHATMTLLRCWPAVVMTTCLAAALVTTGLDVSRNWRVLDAVTGVPYLDDSLHAGSPALPPGCRSAVFQTFSLDSQWYVMHTSQMLRDAAVRVRSTRQDNAPFGRDVHWSAAIPWVAGATATGLAFRNGGEAVDHVTTAAMVVPAGIQAVGAALLLLVCWRAWGFPGASALAVMYLAFPAIAVRFQPSDIDHHGLAETLALGQVIALHAGLAAAARGGQPGSRDRRRPIAWWVLSGIFGGVVMWINAQTAQLSLTASTLGLIVCLCVPSLGIRERLRPVDVLAWGVAGGLTSLVFYAVEYFPALRSCRLEVNHPLWALSWISGAWFLATFVGRRGPGTGAMRPGPLLAGRLAAGFVTVFPLLLVGFLRAGVFIPSDPFIYRLHVAAIREYEPLFAHYGTFEDTWTVVAFFLPHVCAAILTGCWLIVGGQDRGRIAVGVLFFATTATVVQAASILQVRWQHLAAGIWAVYAAALIAGLLAADVSRWRRWLVVGTVVVVMGVATAPMVLLGADAVKELRQGVESVPRAFAPTLMLREIAHWLARDAAPRQPVVLTDPSSATELAFYGNCQVIGTLYWENETGLKRTAMLFREDDEAAFRQAVEAAGVTHIVIPSWAGLACAKAYDFPGVGRPLAARKPSFVDRLVDGQEHPAWLEEVPTRLPEMLGMKRSSVKLYRLRGAPDPAP